MNNNHSTQTTFPPELFKPGGVMEEVFDYINHTARRKQPIFAVSASLALMSLAIGRKYKSYTGIYPNIYLINIGVSGSGKDNPRKANKNILTEAGLIDHLGGDRVASAVAMVAKLQEQPNTLYLLDEIGDWLKSVSSSRAPQHIKEINTTLLTMFTSSDSVFSGTDYADREARKNQPINHPSLSLLGTTTPESFVESLSSKDASSGLLGRFLCFESYDQRPTLDTKEKGTDIPGSIVDWIKKVMVDSSPNSSTKKLSRSKPKTITVKCTLKAQKILYELVKKDEEIAKSEASSTTKNLWVRAFELASKVSLIVACSRDIQNPMVDDFDARYAVKLVTWCIEENCKRINQHVGENETDKQIKRLVMFIENVKGSKNKRYLYFTKHGVAPRSYLMNVMKLNKTTFNEIIDTATGMDKIEEQVYLNPNSQDVCCYILKP